MGGFDEGFIRPSIEDIELGYRLAKAGYDICLLKNLQVTHLKRWELKTLLKTDIFYRAVPWSRLMIQRDHILRDLNLKMRDRISCGAVFMLSVSILLIGELPCSGMVLGLPVLFLLVLNRSLYQFFLKRRGLCFMFKGILFHWFYLFYSGAAFMSVKIESCFKRYFKTIIPGGSR